jgi:hypothetical protein
VGRIDGIQVLHITDTRHSTGLAGVSGGWNPASYDNFRVEQVAAAVPVISAPPVHATTEPPAQPTLFVPIPARNAVRLAWAPTPGATGYRISMVQDDKEFPRWIDAGSATSYKVTTLTNGVRYRFRVVALNAKGKGIPSDEQDATPQ